MIDTNKAVNDIVATLAEDTFVTDDLKEKLSSNDKILNYSFYRDLPAAFDIDGSYLNDLFYLESNKKENVTTYYNQKVLVLDDEKFKEFFGGISNRSLVQFENSDRPYYYIDEGKSKVPYKPKVDKIGIGLSSKLYKSLEVIEKTPINKEEINITKPTMVVVFTEKQASRIFGSGLNELKTSLLINLKNSTDAESVLGFLEINKMISDYFLSDYNRTNRMFSLITKYSIMFSLSILILAIFNVTNAVISNIYSRKDEIKLLSNIGLTKKELKGILNHESRRILIPASIYSIILSILILIVIERLLFYNLIFNLNILIYPLISILSTISIIYFINKITIKLSFDSLILEK